MKSSVFAHKGEQIWNDAHTHGIEFLEDVMRFAPVNAHSVMALGEQEELRPNDLMPEWLSVIVLEDGGYDAYKASKK